MNQQEIYNHLVNQLKMDEEGGKYASRPYRCPAGFWTVGWGYNIDANPLPNEKYPMSEERADELLKAKINYTYAQLNERLAWFKDLDPIRQTVLVNMGYNMGVGGLLKFHDTIPLIKSGQYLKASIEMLDSDWGRDEATKRRARRLSRIMATGQFNT